MGFTLAVNKEGVKVVNVSDIDARVVDCLVVCIVDCIVAASVAGAIA